MDNPFFPVTQLAQVFYLQFYHYFGKLEGFRIIGEKTTGAEEIISQERIKVLILLKTLWEAFSKTVTDELSIEPEDFLNELSSENPEDQHILKALKEIKDEMALLEVDPDRLAILEKRYFVILNGKPRLRLL
ncbi:MAG: hypothetical protein ACYDEQ_02190 [Desulfocucumaceae bacterium]